ncbi:hypothetical protein [Streptomyces albogriseolus]|uniref:hypothetical protein n=1 Tax=Streptomyces albogriseolus TaxID=1887 RepID=UPI0033B37BBB
MADERYRWLDAEAAERLLSGEAPQAAGPPAGDQAEQLAGVLRALSAPPPTAEDELPGEAAALAAFRKSRDERTGQADSAPHTGRGTGPGDADVGLIRLGAPRSGRTGTPGGARGPRPARLLLAAALVAGMVGGTAVLAGTGLLRTPFDDSRSGPAGAATATHPQRPLISPPAQGSTPDDRHHDDPADGGPDGAQGSQDPDRTPPDSVPGDGKSAHGARWKLVVSACRSWHQGRQVNGERRRALHEAAGGASRIAAYCRGVTAKEGAGSKDDKDGKGAKGAGGGTRDAETRLDGDEGERQNTLPGQGDGRPDTDDSDQDKGNGGNGNGAGRGDSGSDADDHPSKGRGNGNGNSQGNGSGNGNGKGNGKQD